jgi:enoyl-CoA hydratase/carnithine racemase
MGISLPRGIYQTLAWHFSLPTACFKGRINRIEAEVQFETLAYGVEDSIATLMFDRPDALNAITPAMEREWLEAFDQIDADDAVRAVIVTGRGRAFCAGADISPGGAGFDVVRRAEERGTEEIAPGDVPRDGGGMMALRIFRCRKPVIGAINGAAVGAGSTVPLAMDARLGSETAKFAMVFARRGMSPDAASSWFLPRLVGIDRALEWMISGRFFDAQEALEAGYLRSIHAAEELLPAARQVAQDLVEQSAPVSVAITRQLLWRMLGAAHPMDAHRVESRAILSRATAEDATEGVEAFLEKRTPNFPSTVSHDMPDGFPWLAEPEF